MEMLFKNYCQKFLCCSHFFNKYTDLPYLKLSLTPRMELFWENSQGDSSGFKKLGFVEQFFLEFDNTY